MAKARKTGIDQNINNNFIGHRELLIALDGAIKADYPIAIYGVHGIGKSMSTYDYVKKNGHKMVEFRINVISDQTHYTGLQFVNPEGQTSHFLKPDWLQDAIEWANKNPEKRVILFFDEWTRPCRFDLLSPVFQIILDKKIGMLELPKNFRFILAANPPTADYQGVVEMNDLALFDRMAHYYLQPSPEEVTSFMKSVDVESVITNYLQKSGEKSMFDLSQTRWEEFSKLRTKSPRKWGAMVDRLLKAMKSDKYAAGYDMDALAVCLPGLIGEETYTFMQFIAETIHQPLTGKEVLDELHKNKELVERLEMIKADGKRDVFKVSLDNATEEMKSRYKKDKNKDLSQQEFVNFLTLLTYGEADYVSNFIKTFQSASDGTDLEWMNKMMTPYFNDAGNNLVSQMKGKSEEDKSNPEVVNQCAKKCKYPEAAKLIYTVLRMSVKNTVTESKGQVS